MLVILSVYFLPISVHSDEGNMPSYFFFIYLKCEIINIVLININTYLLHIDICYKIKPLWDLKNNERKKSDSYFYVQTITEMWINCDCNNKIFALKVYVLLKVTK